MKDNALRIFLFCYIVSACLAAGDVLIAGPLGVQMMAADGTPAGPQLSVITAKMAEHDLAGRLAGAEGGLSADEWWTRAVTAVELGVDMTVELFKLLMGLYIFDVLTIFGIPAEITSIIQTAYIILLARAIIGHLPAISQAVQAVGAVAHTVRAASSVAGHAEPAARAAGRMGDAVREMVGR